MVHILHTDITAGTLPCILKKIVKIPVQLRSRTGTGTFFSEY